MFRIQILQYLFIYLIWCPCFCTVLVSNPHLWYPVHPLKICLAVLAVDCFAGKKDINSASSILIQTELVLCFKQYSVLYGKLRNRRYDFNTENFLILFRFLDIIIKTKFLLQFFQQFRVPNLRIIPFNCSISKNWLRTS